VEPTANLNILTMIHQGWLATYPLVFMSILSLTVIAERLWALRNIVGQTAQLTRGVHQDLTRGDLGAALERAEADRGVPAGRVFSEVVRHGGTMTSDELADIGAERRFEELEQMKRPLWLLGTVASSAPFIGLFGTVIGIIKAFHSMAIMGSGGFAVVAGGISEALVATALGLGVAIIALIFYNYFQVRLDRIESALTIGTARLIEALEAAASTAPKKPRVADGLR
jgi:biopolymer transport protein ExbB